MWRRWNFQIFQFRKQYTADKLIWYYIHLENTQKQKMMMSFFLKGTVCSVVLLSALALTLFKVRNNINLHRKSFIHATHSCLYEESTHSNYYLIIQTVCLYNESNLLTEGIPPVSMGSRTFLWKEVIPVSLRSRNSRKLQNCVKAWNLVETHIRQRSLTKSRERRRVFTGNGCGWVLIGSSWSDFRIS